jgi:DNA-directed RNA polymerase I subunit RPA43
MNPAALVRGPATVNVDLPPAALASPAAGVALALSRRLLRWCPDLGGVLLSYGSVELVGGSHSGKTGSTNEKREGGGTSSGGSAEISDYSGFVRVAAAVGDALVFAPSPGMRLEGTVARVGGDYVGVLALGVFSAAVGGEALSRRFELEEVAVEAEGAAAAAAAGEAAKGPQAPSRAGKTATERAWVCKADRSHRLVEGARVIFDVARVRRSDGGFVSILGSLESTSSGAVGARGVGAAADAAAPSSASAPSAKKKGKSEKRSAPSAAPAPCPVAPASSSKRKKAEACSAEKKEKESKKEPKAKKAKTEKKKKK